jgi:preprotein translocase subunit SecG
MKSGVLKKVGLSLSALFLVTALGLAGCATQEQLNAAVKKAEDAATKAEAAAAKAEAAAAKADADAAKCQKTFEKGLQK